MVMRPVVSAAERVGFEPTVGCPTTVFKTAPFVHSGTSPRPILLHPRRLLQGRQIRDIAIDASGTCLVN